MRRLSGIDDENIKLALDRKGLKNLLHAEQPGKILETVLALITNTNAKLSSPDYMTLEDLQDKSLPQEEESEQRKLVQHLE